MHLKRDWTMQSFYEDAIKNIRQKIGNNKVICALSGGDDSSVTAILLYKAIGMKYACNNEFKKILKASLI